MSDTHTLLSKIAALRQQLAQVQDLAQDAGSAARSLTPPAPGERFRRLERRVADGSQHGHLITETVRKLREDGGDPATPAQLPRLLTAPTRRVLSRGRELLDLLRPLADEPLLQSNQDELLSNLYREAVAMAETALRMVQAFPDAPSAQLRLGAGLEAILKLVGERIAVLVAAVDGRRREDSLVGRLAGSLLRLQEKVQEKGTCEVQDLVTLAEEILGEAEQGRPLRFFDPARELPNVGRFVAARSLTVAQVMAHLVRADPELRKQPVEPLLAALVHDVGMIGVPSSILGAKQPLDDESRRLIEQHVLIGAEQVRRWLPEAPWLVEAVASHHERLDGTGYPAGLRDSQIAPLTRLLSVCDVYAALCSPRPQRLAFDTRTALTDTLLLAEQGRLDRSHAERLLVLSFYPPGTMVELADGALGIVLATHGSRRDLAAPARPVLALLADANGHLLPTPMPLDLAQCDSRSIVRSLSAVERQSVLGARYPEWAA